MSQVPEHSSPWKGLMKRLAPGEDPRETLSKVNLSELIHRESSLLSQGPDDDFTTHYKGIVGMRLREKTHWATKSVACHELQVQLSDGGLCTIHFDDGDTIEMGEDGILIITTT